MEFNVETNGLDDTEAAFIGLQTAAEGVEKWRVGSDVEYAVYLEHGTSRMPPYPFLRPAVQDVMEGQADALADQADSVQQLIKHLAVAIEARAKHYATTGVPPGPDVQSGTLRASITAERA